MAKRRISYQFDEKSAFDKSLDFDFSKNIFVTPELKKFLDLKAVQHAVSPKMFLPGFLVATSNVMGMSKLAFTEDWDVKQNIFILIIAPKGTGKTPTSKTFLGPLIDLEREEKKSFDEQKKSKGKRKNKRKRQNDEEEQNDEELDEDEDTSTEDSNSPNGDSEQYMFHKKTRVADQITPEALIMSLSYGSGNLVIKADEFKGFFDKCIEKADNISAVCSAFSGEEIKYTTIKRGEISIYDSRLNMFGCIQPGPLGELLNNYKEDHQGLWDRFIMIPAAEDLEVNLENQLKPIPEEDKMDVGLYLRLIRDNHKEPRVYTASVDAMEAFKECHKELRIIDEDSNYGNDVSGMTKKAFPNVQKLATVYCCARETLEKLSNPGEAQDEAQDDKDPGVAFTVEKVDVEAAFDVMKQSMQTFKSFKTSLGKELGEVDDEQVDQVNDEDLILGAALKIRKLYANMDGDKKILLSIIKRSRFYPAKVGLERFIKAMAEYSIAKVENRIGNNYKNCEVLVLTTETQDRDTVRVFRLLYDISLANNEIFDPLSLFHEETEK